MDCLLALNASGQLSHGQFIFGHLSLVVTFAKTVRTDFFSKDWTRSYHYYYSLKSICSNKRLCTLRLWTMLNLTVCNIFASSWHQFSHISSASIVTYCTGKCHAQNALGIKIDRFQYLIHLISLTFEFKHTSKFARYCRTEQFLSF